LKRKTKRRRKIKGQIAHLFFTKNGFETEIRRYSR